MHFFCTRTNGQGNQTIDIGLPGQNWHRNYCRVFGRLPACF